MNADKMAKKIRCFEENSVEVANEKAFIKSDVNKVVKNEKNIPIVEAIQYSERMFDFSVKDLKTQHSITKNLIANEFLDIKYQGMGSNSIVYSAKCKRDTIALKMLKHRVNSYEGAKHEISREIEILQKIRHPNIIEIKGSGETPRKFIVLEQLTEGTLDQMLKEHQNLQRSRPDIKFGLPVLKVVSICRDIASALKYLHYGLHNDATIIHRDLKPHNIGFAAGGKLKLFDFGLASCVQRRIFSDLTYCLSGRTGTMVYMAPEVALRQPYNEKVDVYSFGIILWQLLSGQTPFSGFTKDQYIERVAKNGERPPVDEIMKIPNIPHSLVELMITCWDADFMNRPSFTEIYDILNVMFLEIGQAKFPFAMPSVPKWFKSFFRKNKVYDSSLDTTVESRESLCLSNIYSKKIISAELKFC